MMRWLGRLIAALLMGVPGFGASAEPPRVVATIAPVHALVAQVMVGAGTPRLLMPPGASPHDFALRPSDARTLAEAELVVWVGPALEHRLARAIARLGQGRELRLSEVRGLVRLPAREGEHGGAEDPHYWLDPVNARLWLEAIAATLGRLDPERRALYTANAGAARAELEALEAEIAARLAPLAGRPFIVVHDAYRYFENRFGLEALAAVVPADDRPPGPARVARVRQLMQAEGVRCLVRAPGEDAALARALATASGARVVVLDPIGHHIPPGPTLYPRLLRDLAKGFADCLGAPGGG